MMASSVNQQCNAFDSLHGDQTSHASRQQYGSVPSPSSGSKEASYGPEGGRNGQASPATDREPEGTELTSLIVHSEKKTRNEGNADDAPCVPSISEIQGVTNNQGSLAESLVSVDMPKDTLSMFEIARIGTTACTLSVIVFIFQMTIYMLIFWDLIDNESTHNPFKIPTAVGWQVSVAQVISLCITAGVQLPNMASVAVVIGLSINDISVSERFSAKQGPRMILYRLSRMKEWVGLSCRVIESFCAAGASLLLIIQSTSVIELFFNFAALQFVSFLAQLAFIIARDGIFGVNSRTTEIALTIENTKISMPAKTMNLKLRFSRIVVSVVFVGLMMAWVVVFRRQKDGYYDCQSLFVQFADDFEVSCGLLSGIYTIASAREFNGRPVYENKDVGGILVYENKMWTFSGPNCKVSSTETMEYDVLLVGDSAKWSVGSPVEEYSDGILSHFSLTCNDCNREADNICSSRGKCVGHQCVCDKGEYDGPLCEIRNPALYCEILTAKEGITSYKILRKPDQDPIQFVRIYERPVYVTVNNILKENNGAVVKVDGVWRFLMFMGRRWILGDAREFFGTRDINNITDILSNTPIGKVIWGEEYYEKNADLSTLYEHAQMSLDAIIAVSEASDYGTLEYQEGPNLKTWYRPAPKVEKGFGVHGNNFLGIMPSKMIMRQKAYSCEPHCSGYFDFKEGWANELCKK